MAENQSNFSEKLGAILNDPQAMSQILSLAQSLGQKAPLSTISGENNPQKVTKTQEEAVPEVRKKPGVDPGPTPDQAGVATGTEGGALGGDPGPNRGQAGTFSSFAAGEGDLPPLDPKWMAVGMKALEAYRTPNSNQAALLTALKPFLKESRQGKVDKALQIAKLSKMVRAVLEGMKGGDGSV